MRSLKPLANKLLTIGGFALIALLYCTVSYLILGKVQLCIWRAVCGFPCPGCGLTHAGIFLLSGNIRESLYWNPFLVPIVITIAGTSVPAGWSKLTDRFRRMRWFFTTLMISTVLYYVYRLIRFYPQDPEVGPIYYEPQNYIRVFFSWIAQMFQ